MGFMKTMFIIIIIIVAIAFLQPNTYETGKNWVFDKIKDFVSSKVSDTAEDKLQYTNETYGKDYGKIFGFKDCETNEDCETSFKIKDMLCHSDGTCYLEG